MYYLETLCVRLNHSVCGGGSILVWSGCAPSEDSQLLSNLFGLLSPTMSTTVVTTTTTTPSWKLAEFSSKKESIDIKVCFRIQNDI
jgi:hypothetical protein